MSTSATISLFESRQWRDYELLDSGDGQKLERFGPYVLVRPEAQAIWSPALGRSEWERADAIFRPSGEESGGHWDERKKMADKWEMAYSLQPDTVDGATSQADLRFWAMTTPGRHLGVFPESASNWDFISARLRGGHLGAVPDPASNRDLVTEKLRLPHSQPKILNLFGYTGLASLAGAMAGAQVTHVDASKKSVEWARQNQALSGLQDRPIRWIVDDALKFAAREVRRGAQYDGLIVDPPKFGRGPKGEVWELYKSLPRLMHMCRSLLVPAPRFVILAVYAVRASAIHAAQLVGEIMADCGGVTQAGELVTRESSGGRLLSQAVVARWSPQ